MTVLAVTLTALGLTDLLRGDTSLTSSRTSGAALASIAVGCALARLTGLDWWIVGVLAGCNLVVVAGWLLLDAWARHDPPDRRAPAVALVWIVGALLAAFAASGAVPAMDGSLGQWFSGLDLGPAESSRALEQFVIATTAGVFLLATANRLVRLVLAVAQTPTQKAESRLRGGRLIGAMERLFIGAMLVAGEPTGIAIVVAAKGLLRLPEIQRNDATELIDEFTEYFLIGTFASMLIAIAAAGAVLAVG